MNSSTEIVDDPRYPDRIGVGDSPGIPCKVTEFSVTTAPTGAPIDQGPALNAVYDQVRQYRIRYELPPAMVEQGSREGLDAAIRAKVAEARLKNWTTVVETALLAAIDLHKPEWHGSKQICWHCVYPMGGDNVDWPCETATAIAKALGIEVADA